MDSTRRGLCADTCEEWSAGSRYLNTSEYFGGKLAVRSTSSSAESLRSTENRPPDQLLYLLGLNIQ